MSVCWHNSTYALDNFDATDEIKNHRLVASLCRRGETSHVGLIHMRYVRQSEIHMKNLAESLTLSSLFVAAVNKKYKKKKNAAPALEEQQPSSTSQLLYSKRDAQMGSNPFWSIIMSYFYSYEFSPDIYVRKFHMTVT